MNKNINPNITEIELDDHIIYVDISLNDLLNHLERLTINNCKFIKLSMIKEPWQKETSPTKPVLLNIDKIIKMETLTAEEIEN